MNATIHDPQDLAKIPEDEARAWKIVERTFDAGDLCADCQYCRTWEEYHGPGMREPLSECMVMVAGSEPGNCPGVEAAAEEEDEDAT